MVKLLIGRALRWLGYEVISYTPMRSHELRRAALLREKGVRTVLDGGANTGQYAARLRRLGYNEEIISVEPIPRVFRHLRERTLGDSRWTCVNAALARQRGSLTLNLASISEVSSVLPATGAVHTEAWRVTDPIVVPALSIDDLLQDRDHSFIKLDLQGYEMEALEGAGEALGRAVAIEVELSTVPLYQGAALLPEMVNYLADRGYSLFSVEPALVDHVSGRVLQLDGIFVK